MKKLTGIALICFLFISITATAQEKKQEIKKRTNFTSEQFASIQAKKMRLRLGLDEKQEKEIWKLFKDNADRSMQLRKERKERKEKGIELTSEEKYQLLMEGLDRKIKQQETMKNILTNDQFEKLKRTNRGDRLKNRRASIKNKSTRRTPQMRRGQNRTYRKKGEN